MKVVVQNGASHGFSRAQMELLVSCFPRSWACRISSVVLYQGTSSTPEIKYYPKEAKIGFFWPTSPITKDLLERAAEELVLACAFAAEKGAIPARISKSQRVRHSAQVAQVLASYASSHERSAT